MAARLVAALVAAVLLSACWIASREETGDPAPVISEQPATTVDPDDAPAVADDPVRKGRHAAYLDSVDADAVVFDPIAFVTGGAARKIYDAEHPDQRGGPPNDYLIVNLSTARWRAPVAPEVEIQIVAQAGDGPVELVDASVDELTQHVAEQPGPMPYWLVVRDGAVVSVEEQYLP